MTEMKAVRRCYVNSLQAEFGPGETFSVSDEKEVRRLIRRRTAEVAGAVTEATTPRAPESGMQQEVAPATPALEAEEERPRSRRTYNRRDVRAEE